MLTLIKDNVEYPLDDGSIGYYLGDQGWGMMPLHRISEHGPLQDGETDRGYRAEARIGKLYFELVGSSRYDLYLRHLALMNLFDPSAALKLRWDVLEIDQKGQEGETLTRQFDVVYSGDMDFPAADKKGFSQKVSVKLKASDPTCYDPNRQLVEYNGGGGAGFRVPVIVPMTFGVSTFDITQSIEQVGNADEYPEITIVGPITSPIISNLSYGEKLDFTGTTISAGVTWVIDTRYGYKTIIELPSTNRLDKLSQDSDLATFRLRKGYNDIRAQGTGITSATKIQIRYYFRYTGV